MFARGLVVLPYNISRGDDGESGHSAIFSGKANQGAETVLQSEKSSEYRGSLFQSKLTSGRAPVVYSFRCCGLIIEEKLEPAREATTSDPL